MTRNVEASCGVEELEETDRPIPEGGAGKYPEYALGDCLPVIGINAEE